MAHPHDDNIMKVWVCLVNTTINQSTSGNCLCAYVTNGDMLWPKLDSVESGQKPPIKPRLQKARLPSCYPRFVATTKASILESPRQCLHKDRHDFASG